MTQKMEVYEHMKQYGTITTMQAYSKGITRLASRIHELRKDGINIKSENVIAKNRHGKTIHYFKYSLVNT